MAKSKKNTGNKAEEPKAIYRTVKKIPSVKEHFSKKHTQKIMQQLPFSVKEWAQILHLSERTLQRYAKDNKPFEGMYADRLLQIEELAQKGKKVFTNIEGFYQWLKQEKKVLNNTLNFNSLTTTFGIQQLSEELDRIQHGIYI